MHEKTVIINFKHYANAVGKNSFTFLEKLSESRIPDDVNIYCSMNLHDLASFNSQERFRPMAQHVDDVDFGAHTGKISVQFLKNQSIEWSLLNHSEYRIDPELIESTIHKANEIEFNIVLCVENEKEATRYAGLKPSFIAYEPPELIGGNISVSTSKPEIIENVVSIADKHGVRVLVGAGVKKYEDYRKSLELGAEGILVASGIVLADDPAASLNSLINSQSP